MTKSFGAKARKFGFKSRERSKFIAELCGSLNSLRKRVNRVRFSDLAPIFNADVDRWGFTCFVNKQSQGVCRFKSCRRLQFSNEYTVVR